MVYTPKRRAKRAAKAPAAPMASPAPIALADVLAPTHEQVGSGFDPGAVGHELQGRASAPPETPAEAPTRRRRAKLGTAALKLAAPDRPGFKRRFFNDDGNRIAEAHELGYDIVSETRAKSPGLGSHDIRNVGTKASGEPLRAILMETPDELYAEGLAEKEAQSAAIDLAIMSGRDSEGQMSQIPQDERYGQVSMKRDR